jgi:hypothetical protein
VRRLAGLAGDEKGEAMADTRADIIFSFFFGGPLPFTPFSGSNGHFAVPNFVITVSFLLGRVAASMHSGCEGLCLYQDTNHQQFRCPATDYYHRYETTSKYSNIH